MNQPFGKEAKQFTYDQAFGKTLNIHEKDKDRYGRVVAVIELPDDRILNHELVRNGLAWWYRKYAKDDEVLEILESTARDVKIGLWIDEDAVAPWEWRRGKRP